MARPREEGMLPPVTVHSGTLSHPSPPFLPCFGGKRINMGEVLLLLKVEDERTPTAGSCCLVEILESEGTSGFLVRPFTSPVSSFSVLQSSSSVYTSQLGASGSGLLQGFHSFAARSQDLSICSHLTQYTVSLQETSVLLYLQLQPS